jgi:hypothetical protein
MTLYASLKKAAAWLSTQFNGEQEFWENIMFSRKAEWDYVLWGALEKQSESKTNTWHKRWGPRDGAFCE